MKLNKIQSEFCALHNLTAKQFFGKETVGGDLGLDGLTSIPTGFNPTVGGSLWLDGLTSIPTGFNPTVGGDLGLDGLTSIPTGFNPTVGGDLGLRYGLKTQTSKPKADAFLNSPKNKLLFWQDGKFVSADRMLTEVLNKKGNVYKVRKLHSTKEFYLVTDGKTHAHGDTLKQAKEDFGFKLVSEKLKSEPILEDTLITVAHYRMITGACNAGIRDFMKSNGLEFTIVNAGTSNEKTVEKNPIKAKDLLPLLQKNGSYGMDKFKSLLTF